MLKTKLTAFAASVLLLSLTACNTNNGALDERNQNTTRFRDVNYNDEQGFEKDYERELRDTRTERMEISNLKTDTSSDNYPRTRAVLMRDAKYKFVTINPEQNRSLTRDERVVQNGTPDVVPEQQQQERNDIPNATPQQQQQQENNTENNPGTTANISQTAQKVIELTNAERRKNGLPDLKGDPSLSSVAQKKSEDMEKNHYFSHTSPTYGSPFDMMRNFGITYKTAGENIAQGQRSAEQVVQAWMNSEGHRKNILNRNFTHIGIGYEQNGNHWTQMFIGK
ncbi:CAP domain-containing protein [Metabacillus fastidiosus]|uniref:CAP domain-containing protein n=1 Tax=Metabacillus fastidiosus TaxID=1458 RepID=UPI002DB655B1|nr:CAP domain-containing protein [Metabacillus fastidiosus]MEC2077966.1 CAP domain-containing protein [Metabacillus fastidiosus]